MLKLEIGSGVVHILSYQFAHLTENDVVFSNVIVKVNNLSTSNLDEFIEAIKTLSNVVRVLLKFYHKET